MTKGERPVDGPKIAAAMQRVRKAEGVSQVELARRLECTQQYVSKFEQGLVTITPTCVARVADALGVPAEVIWEESRKSSASASIGCTTNSASLGPADTTN